MSARTERGALLAAGLLLLACSAIAPHDYPTWALEVFPIVFALPVLIFTARRFPLTPLAYRLIFLHALVLMLGGHYTYALVPVGDWVRDWLHLTRNPYDRLGHFVQGFVPAILAREIFLRLGVVRGRGWLFFLVACVCLAISACYELVEWATAVAFGSGSEAFLGTQGDEWDSQWDMFTALIGCLGAQLTLQKWHDRELAQLSAGAPQQV